MALKARIKKDSAIQSSVKQDGVIQTTTVAVSPSIKLIDLADVDTTLLGDGSIVIYNQAEQRFETKQEIDNPNTHIIGGSF